MIHDAYTKEYDERMRRKAYFDNIELVASTAKRFGLNIFLHESKVGASISVRFPNGTLFKRFNKIEEAFEWARKWNY